jgi:predicted transcriptional regulator
MKEATMEQIKSNPSAGPNFEAGTVKDIIEPANCIFNNVSVRTALEELQAWASDSSPVIDQRGELLGTVSRNQMNRKVGGFGHDPTTEPVEAQIEKNNPYCFADQAVAEVEQMMHDLKVGEVPVVTREKLLLGTVKIEAIAQEKRRRKRLRSKPVSSAKHSASK